MKTALPRFVRDLLSACPTAGNGVNNWLFRCARALHPHRSPDVIESLLTAASENCGRNVIPTEIARAIANSRQYSTQPNGKHKRPWGTHKWPAPNLDEIEAIVTRGPGVFDLWERSPVRFDDEGARTEEIVDALFPEKPLLCVGESSHAFDTRPREQWRNELGAKQLIVPSAMSAATGLTQEGKPSSHCLDNTGPRRFLVVECDFSIYAKDEKTETAYAPLLRRIGEVNRGIVDACAAVLCRLAQLAPLALVVHSGGKSLHGWFACTGQPEEKLHQFMRRAVSIGADPMTWTRSQFVRMPDGLRDNGVRQNVMFFNPNVIP